MPETAEHITGEVLVGLRKRLGLSQPALAERLGISTNTIYRWENDLQHHLKPLAYWCLRGMLAEKEAA